MCNAYYIIIIAELRQAFFEDFFIFSESTRYCTFFVFLSFTPHTRFFVLSFFYQYYRFLNQYFPDKFFFLFLFACSRSKSGTNAARIMH